MLTGAWVVIARLRIDIMMLFLHHNGMKTRLQIQLDPEDYRALKSWASAYGISMSAAVRVLIRERLRHDDVRIEAAERFVSAAGVLEEREEQRDVSREHDRYLYGGAE